MSRRLIVIALSVILGLFLAPDIVAEENHIAEAIKNVKAAIGHGKEGHVNNLRTYVETALAHAEAAEKAATNPHTKQAITHLNESVDHAKQGHADVATKHAEEALTHLDAATK